MHPTNEDELIVCTKSWKTKTSTGIDCLSTKIVQQIINEIASPRVHIINHSFTTGIVPDKLKIAKTIPIFKAGNNTYIIQ